MTAGIVIIGAGKAGAAAASVLAQAGQQVTLLGAEAHAPYDRPPLSKAVLLEESVPPPALVPLPVAVAFCSGAAAVEIDRARHQLRLADGSVLDYAELLLATWGGATPSPGGGGRGVSADL